MNRIYRIVFNRSLGLRQVVSELARSRGKGGTKIRRLALSISAALEVFTQPSSATVPASVAPVPESPRRRFAHAASLVLPAAMSLGVMLPVTAHAGANPPAYALPSSTSGVDLAAYAVSGGNFVVGAGVTISSNGQAAIYGPVGYTFTLTNYGSIKGVGMPNAGVDGIGFLNGGTITNKAGGIITSDLYGIYMAGGVIEGITNSGTISATGDSGRGIGLPGGGTVTNNGGGSISGAFAGIITGGRQATVTNNSGGTISGTAAYGTGIYLRAGGSVTNSGTVTGGSKGIYVGTAAGTITNSGNINGGNSGVYMQTGGTLTNLLGGSITGGSAGVLTKTGALDITNNGNITATGVGGIGVDLHGGGSVTNNTTLTISGSLSGIRGSGAAVDVNNTFTGFILGTDANHGTGVDLEAGGSVTNDRYSRIFGTYAGVLGGSAAPVTITNDGTISSGGTIVNLASDAAIHLLGGGSITNDATGSLSGISYGVLMGAAASVTNDGTITAYNGVGVYARADGTVINHAGGVITGYTVGVRLAGTGSVTNAGVIQAGGTAVNSAAVHLSGGGSIDNAATGRLSSMIYGVLMDTVASVTNDGTITGNRGIGVYSRGGGTVTNHVGGAIYGYTTGVWLASAGSVTNAGIIRATGTPANTVPVTAIHLLGGGSIANAATGSLFGDDYGVLMDVTASVTNDGSINAGRGIGVGSSEGGTVINHAGGVITGNETGVRLASSGSVTNAGTISAAYNSVVLAGNNSLLTLQTGSSLVGTALASGTGSQLQLDGNGSSSNGFSGFGTVSTTAGTQWTVSGGVTATGNLGVSTDTGSQLTLSGNVTSQGLTKQGDGTLVIDDTATNSGNAEVMAGRLIVGSDTAHAGTVLQGDVQVDSGAAIGGHGELSGNLNVLGGGHLAPGNSIGTLTVGGNVTLAQGSQIDFGFGAPGAHFSQGVSDSVAVHGDLSLNGATLNITDAGGMGPGLYNLFTYDGTLTEANGGIVLDSMPGGGYAIQNLTASKQINLIDTAGLTLAFWNANGQAGPTQMGGGSGTWSTTSPKWTDSVGSITGPMTPQPGFAIFAGAAGTVTVDNTAGTVAATGLQFVSDGYTLTGDTLTLVGSNGVAPVIHVGNGSAAGAAWTATIGNVIAGSDGIDKTDLGTLVLTGSNTYTGTTTIDAGTLALQGAGSIAGTSGVIVNGTFDISGTPAGASIPTLSGSGQVALGSRTLTLTQAADTFAGAISGSGSLVISGNESLTGSSSYSGGTQLISGSLSLGNASAIGSGTLAMANGTSIAFGDSFTLSNAITLSGDPTVNVATGTTTELSGVIADGSSAGDLVKTGGGTLLLSGTNTYTGATEVAAGTLNLQGSVASTVTVDTGASLTGAGAIGGLHATAGATITPGSDAIGTLTVKGNAIFEEGSNYQVNVTDTGSSDLVHVTGTAVLHGGSIIGLAAGTNWEASAKYTILTADGGVTGSFGSVTSNFAFLTPTLTYDADNAYLTLARNDAGFASLGVTRNQRVTAAAIESLGTDATLYKRIVTLDAGQAAAAFNNLAGASLAGNRTAIVDDSRYVRDAIGNHLQGIDDHAQSDDQGSVWTSTWGHWGSNDGNANTGSQNSNGSGLLVGADRDLGATRLGAVIAHSQLSSNSGGDSAHGTADHIGLYAATELGAWQLQGGAAHSWYQTSSQRAIAVPGLIGHANADYNSGVTQAYVDGGYRFGFAQGSLAPFVNLAHVWVHEGAIHEHGSDADLDVQANSSGVSYGTAGLRGSYTPTKGIELHASLGYQHAWGDLASNDTQRFTGGVDSFTVDGVPVAKNTGIADVGLRFDLRKNISVDATYHGQFGGQAKDQSGRLALNMSF